MKNLFPGYCSLSSDEIREIWDNCIFVFDTNVLLDLYRLSDDSSRNLLETIKILCEKDKFWVPYQVASEYTSNLYNVIDTQSKSYDNVICKIQDVRDNIKKKVGHPYLTKDELKQFDDNLDSLINVLKDKKKNVFNLLYSNSINSELMSYLTNRIGERPSKDKYAQLVKEGEERSKNNIPPGYKDKKKDGNEYGDYIIWNYMIEYSKTQKRDLIFVTSDVKEDWFVKKQGKTIGPRPELINEFFELTNRHRFHIVKLDYFLKELSEMDFGVEIKETTVKEIKQQQEKVVSEQTESYVSNLIYDVKNDNCSVISSDSIGYINNN